LKLLLEHIIIIIIVCLCNICPFMMALQLALMLLSLRAAKSVFGPRLKKEIPRVPQQGRTGPWKSME